MSIKEIEFAALLNNLKPVIRQGYQKRELDFVKEYCRKNNLHYVVSPLKTVLLDEGFSNKGVLVKEGDNSYKGREIFFVYISKDELLANKALLAELKEDDIELGKLLGYPECCINFFVEHKNERKKDDFNYENLVLKNSKKDRYPYYMNIFRREENISLLSHFPCSLDCEESQEYGRKISEIANGEKLKGKVVKFGREIEFY